MKIGKKLYSGIQPSGKVHLGNYLGAIKNWVTLSKTYKDPLFCLVDLHALTSISKMSKFSDVKKSLKSNMREVTKTLLACGLSPNECTIYQQSQVPYHAHLMWILSCRSSISVLEQIPQFRSKVQENLEISSEYTPPLGLLSYPVLMSSDILLFKAEVVPVGDDQTHHMELTRKLAESFNKSAGAPFFPIPQQLTTNAARVMSLSDPNKKMSKSFGTDRARIHLSDTPNEIRSKISKAKTDCLLGISYDPINRPELANLIRIYAAITNETEEEVAKRHENDGSGKFKDSLSEIMIDHFKPIQIELDRLSREDGYVDQILNDGAKKANEIALKTMNEIHNLVGLSNLHY